DFTNALTVVQGSCQSSESLSVMVVTNAPAQNCTTTTGCVVAWVPESDWESAGTNSGVAAVNVEGNYLVTSPVLVPTSYQGVKDYINSCASDPLLNPPQTVCTASNNVSGQSKNVYVIEGTSPTVTSVVQTSASGIIQFSGGYCRTCGVAMDARHAKAVIGLSLNYQPGFQFLNLATDTIEA